MQMPKICVKRLNAPTSFLFYPKFERYRSKIIQATFSMAGSKAPQAEVTDEELLEAMQVRGSFKLCSQQLARGWWDKRTLSSTAVCLMLSTPLHIPNFQKIINERMEFHQMLKQKGVKVPSLHSIDVFTSSPTSAKGRRKSPARQHLLTPEKQP